MCQYRFGILPLAIETGRYKNIQLENRICILCNRNEIEDECHFLLNCCLYENERHIFLNKISYLYNEFANLDQEAKFIFLLRLKGKDCLLLARYLTNIWEKRKMFIYNKK